MITRVPEEAALDRSTGMPAREILLVAGTIVLLTALNFFFFPGHTYLQSDTQVYIPILEHLWDPSVFRHDLLAQDPHVSFTIYDEAAILLRRITGLGFREALIFQQVIFRALGLLGVFLIASALLGPQHSQKRPAARLAPLLVTAVFALGAAIPGPSVLLFEYEPVPRGFAIPLVFLAVGLVAYGRNVWAGVAAAVAFLYHPPSLYPYWIVYFCLTLWPSRPDDMRRRILGLVPILCGVLALLALSRLQAGGGEPQTFFSAIGPELEKLQRLRANYNWVSIWTSIWIWHYLFLWLVGFAAFLRVRKSAAQDLAFFLIGLPLVGMASLPVSYFLLEKMKWSLIPQIQPVRALLFATAMAMILPVVASVKASARGRYWESLLWLLPALAVPVHTRVLDVLLPKASDPLIVRRALVVLALATCATAALWAAHRKARWAGGALWAAAILLPFFVIPNVAKVRNYPPTDVPGLDALSAWAQSSTPKDAVFQFPDAGRDVYPGVFRANALRAVYADWKAGGQVNFLKVFADVWWPRWQQTGAGKFVIKDPDAYARMGIDYVVLRRPNSLPGRSPVFENPAYRVYPARAEVPGQL